MSIKKMEFEKLINGFWKATTGMITLISMQKTFTEVQEALDNLPINQSNPCETLDQGRGNRPPHPPAGGVPSHV